MPCFDSLTCITGDLRTNIILEKKALLFPGALYKEKYL